MEAFNIDDTLTRFVEVVIGMGIGRVNLNSVLCSFFIFHPTANNEGKGNFCFLSNKNKVLKVLKSAKLCHNVNKEREEKTFEHSLFSHN